MSQNFNLQDMQACGRQLTVHKLQEHVHPQVHCAVCRNSVVLRQARCNDCRTDCDE